MAVRAHPPWFTDNIREAKKARQWGSFKLTVHLDIFRSAQRNVTNPCAAAKSSQKELFKISNDLLHRSKSHPLPTHNDPQEFADEFANYFSSKISQIHDSFPPVGASPHSEDGGNAPVFDSFLLTTEDELKEIIMYSSSKSCALDPIPTSIRKQCLDYLLSILVTSHSHQVLSRISSK